MLSLENVKEIISTLKKDINDKYNVNTLYVFGSYARDEQTAKSDLDLLVDFKKTPDLLTFIEMEDFLSKKIGIHVDLVPKRKLKPQIRDTILHEAIAV